MPSNRENKGAVHLDDLAFKSARQCLNAHFLLAFFLLSRHKRPVFLRKQWHHVYGVFPARLEADKNIIRSSLLVLTDGSSKVSAFLTNAGTTESKCCVVSSIFNRPQAGLAG